MISDDDFERARQELVGRIESRSILNELAEDPASAVPLFMMGMIFGIPPWLGLLAVFAGGRDPIGADMFGIATIGFLISLTIASRLGAKERAKRIESIRTLPPLALAKRYCNDVHPNDHPQLWSAMNRFRNQDSA